jgi:nucleoid-associated protein YgaU
MLNKNLALIVLVVFAAGCGVEARTYVMTKDRVGLDQTGGNNGCIMGKCPPPPPPTETTRKIYVLELTRPVPESEVQKIEQNAVNAIAESVETPPTTGVEPAESAPAATDNTQAAPAQPVIPVIGDEPAATEAAPATPNGGSMQAQTYTVQKDDTLQKISKKIFGSYGKWYKIYEANKDKIKNPNILQPGTVLTIPAIQNDDEKKGS